MRKRGPALAAAVVIGGVALLGPGVLPEPDRVGHQPQVEITSLGTPLVFANSSPLVHSRFGPAKIYTVVAGYPATFQVADLETGTVETVIPFPHLAGIAVHAMVVGDDGTVYMGAAKGRLWSWRPGDQELTDLGRATGQASAIWDLELGPNGVIWGVTSPDASLFAYDPHRGRFISRTRLSSGHTYARSLAVQGDQAFVALGPRLPTIRRVQLSDPTRSSELRLPVRLKSGIIPSLESLNRYLAVSLPGGVGVNGSRVGPQMRLFDTRLQTWQVPANRIDQFPSEMDRFGRFFYFTDAGIEAVNSWTGERYVLGLGNAHAHERRLGRGRLVVSGPLRGTDGDWLLVDDETIGLRGHDLRSGATVQFPVWWQPSALYTKSMAVGPDGKLYLGGFGGGSLAIVDPASGESDQYPTDRFAAGTIGEVEGMATQGPYQFLGSYASSKIFRYDSREPWVDGENPNLVGHLASSGQDRPMAWATTGQRTVFGTVPKYGRLGGALGIIETPDSGLEVVREPVPGQSLVAMAAEGDIVYIGTSRWGGLGSTPSQPTAKLFAYDLTQRRVLWQTSPAGDPAVQAYGAVALAADGSLWATDGSTVFELDKASGAVVRQVTVSDRRRPAVATYVNASLVSVGDTLYLSCDGRIVSVQRDSLRHRIIADDATHRAMVAMDGAVFYTAGTELKKITLR